MRFVKIRSSCRIGDQHAHQHRPSIAPPSHARFEDAPADARFATSVAAFGEILRGAAYSRFVRL